MGYDLRQLTPEARLVHTTAVSFSGSIYAMIRELEMIYFSISMSHKSKILANTI